MDVNPEIMEKYNDKSLDVIKESLMQLDMIPHNYETINEIVNDLWHISLKLGKVVPV